MMLIRFVTILLLVAVAGNSASALTCQGLFVDTSVLSRFTTEDQEALTTLARRQVELSFNYSISKVQKDAALNHLAEQLETFISDSRLTTQQERSLRQEYRALVFQFKKELSGEIDNQTRTASEIRKAIDQQIADRVSQTVVNSLMEKYWVNSPNEILHAIMQHTITSGRNDDFKLALTLKEIDVNAVKPGKQTPIHSATFHEDFFVEALIKSPNLDVNLRNKSGFTAFELALDKHETNAEESISMARLISSHVSFDPNIISRYGNSLFHSTIVRYRTPKIAYIIASHPKFDVNNKDTSGLTPLHLSTVNPDLVSLLVSKGADLNARDFHGSTALHFAIYSEYSTVSAEILIANGVNINARNKDGKTALHIAVERESIKTVELLLNAKDIDLNVKDAWDQTPLLLALKADSQSDLRQKIVELLESKGATQ